MVDEALIEHLAEAVHVRWMEGRLAEGWTHGPVRDEAAKQHPCLVPYNDLPESEREYDRATVRATLDGLKNLGYRIQGAGDGKE
ncbi:hypothetical protein PDESU_05747 [Pontiella desulfatans]|uniref:Ryanodine receptor Ryr domain-containing protein n=1 Tax=Pontiella desulfatans TaxID=2750659 RepID=A0A6C2UAK4_PONDE|nr:RyR domain-containing protein [Pontiella desulfatans]VGO17152.1 hypothetical protein PDESU_05747 [Pontiella desulfatans]